MWRTDACEVKDNSDWILIKHPHPPKSPPPALSLRPAILTPTLQGQMNENEQSRGVIPRVSNQYPSSSPPSSSSPVFPPTFSPTPLVLLFAAIIFPSSSPLLRLKNWHVFDKGKSTPEHKRFSPYLGLFFFPSLFRSLSLYPLSWVENEQHLLLSLLHSRSKESIIVTTATERSHKEGVSALRALTRAETERTSGDRDEVMSK